MQGIYGEGQALVYDYTAIDPGATWIDPDVPQYPYDPEMATQLLEEAGWDFDQNRNSSPTTSLNWIDVRWRPCSSSGTTWA
ncbi:MAG: hypothetical protein R2873_23480 [Caldilineaceae bacterium]